MDKVRAVIVERSSAVYSWKLGQDIEACENHNAGSRKHVNSQQPTLSTRLHELHPNAFFKDNVSAACFGENSQPGGLTQGAEAATT